MKKIFFLLAVLGGVVGCSSVKVTEADREVLDQTIGAVSLMDTTFRALPPELQAAIPAEFQVALADTALGLAVLQKSAVGAPEHPKLYTHADLQAAVAAAKKAHSGMGWGWLAGAGVFVLTAIKVGSHFIPGLGSFFSGPVTAIADAAIGKLTEILHHTDAQPDDKLTLPGVVGKINELRADPKVGAYIDKRIAALGLPPGVLNLLGPLPTKA